MVNYFRWYSRCGRHAASDLEWLHGERLLGQVALQHVILYQPIDHTARLEMFLEHLQSDAFGLFSVGGNESAQFVFGDGHRQAFDLAFLITVIIRQFAAAINVVIFTLGAQIFLGGEHALDLFIVQNPHLFEDFANGHVDLGARKNELLHH